SPARCSSIATAAPLRPSCSCRLRRRTSRRKPSRRNRSSRRMNHRMQPSSKSRGASRRQRADGDDLRRESSGGPMKRLLSFALMALLLVSVSALADEAGEVGKNLSVKTFQFRNKQAEKAASVIKSLMSADGSMSIQPASNSLIVTDLAENLKKISAALTQF